MIYKCRVDTEGSAALEVAFDDTGLNLLSGLEVGCIGMMGLNHLLFWSIELFYDAFVFLSMT